MKVPQPHNHTIRDFSKPDSPLSCPTLLATECSYCHKVGHTKNYCKTLNDRNHSDHHHSVGVSSANKRVYIVENNGWSSLSSRVQIPRSEHTDIRKIQKVGKLMNAFAALEMDADDDEEADDEEDDDEEDDDKEDDDEEADDKEANNEEIVKVFTNEELREKLGIKSGTSWTDACWED